MIETEVDIANLSLVSIKKKTVLDLTSSVEGRVCARWLPTVRRTLIAKQPWTFARKLKALAVKTNAEALVEWGYAYDMPDEALKLYKFVREGENPMQRDNDPVPTFFMNGVVYSNEPDLRAFYTVDVPSPVTWSPSFDQAVAMGLALRIAPTLVRNSRLVSDVRAAAEEVYGEAAELDAQQEASMYPHTGQRHHSARQRQPDGSVIWT